LQDEQLRIFEPFYRGSNIGEIEGMGLGLTIVRSIVDLLGGDITVVSPIHLDSGIMFTIQIPTKFRDTATIYG